MEAEILSGQIKTMSIKDLGVEPSFATYPDDGCDVSISCLQCPLSLCKYDDPRGYQQYLRKQKYVKIVDEIKLLNLSIKDASTTFNLNKRTISKMLRES